MFNKNLYIVSEISDQTKKKKYQQITFSDEINKKKYTVLKLSTDKISVLDFAIF